MQKRLRLRFHKLFALLVVAGSALLASLIAADTFAVSLLVASRVGRAVVRLRHGTRSLSLHRKHGDTLSRSPLLSKRLQSLATVTRSAAGKTDPPVDRTEDPTIELFDQIESQDEEGAQELAYDEEVAASIAAEASSKNINKLELELQAKARSRLAEVEAAKELPSSPVRDLESLCSKYGGVDAIYECHKVAAEEGYYNALPALKTYLYDYVAQHFETAMQSFTVFEHARGARLVLVGTNHISRASADLARDMVRIERPECLVLERRLGDDSLQRLTVPEELYQDMSLADAPGKFREGDGPIDMARSFQCDRVWLEASPGWRDIGSEAAICQEFGAAFDEFAKLHSGPGGSRGGGTLCFADSDLRRIMEGRQGTLKPNMMELGEGANMPLRDLQMAQALRVALRTHVSVVGVVGRDHLAGIKKLLTQDRSISVVKEGVPVQPPKWQRVLDEGGKQWEREALGASMMFVRLAETSDTAPLGTFLSSDAVKQLYDWKQETERRFRAEGPDVAEPAAPVSSAIATDFFQRGLAVTPKDADELKRWLAGEDVGGQEAGDFPFENRKLRSKPPPLPATGFPLSEEELEELRVAEAER